MTLEKESSSCYSLWRSAIGQRYWTTNKPDAHRAAVFLASGPEDDSLASHIWRSNTLPISGQKLLEKCLCNAHWQMIGHIIKAEHLQQTLLVTDSAIPYSSVMVRGAFDYIWRMPTRTDTASYEWQRMQLISPMKLTQVALSPGEPVINDTIFSSPVVMVCWIQKYWNKRKCSWQWSLGEVVIEGNPNTCRI